MRSRQSETGDGMVKGGRVPPFGGMASGAIRGRKRRAGSRMGRIISLLPRCQVTLRISAIRRPNRQVVIVVDMAGRAWNIGVPVRQQKSR